MHVCHGRVHGVRRGERCLAMGSWRMEMDGGSRAADRVGRGGQTPPIVLGGGDIPPSDQVQEKAANVIDYTVLCS